MPASLAHALADVMPHIVWTHSLDGVPTYFNRRWVEYTGANLESTLREGAETFVHPADQEHVIRSLGESRRTASPVELEYRLRAADGTYRWHRARVAPAHDSSGRAFFVGTAIDIEDEKRKAEESAFLVQASAVLGTSLHVQKTLNDVARLAVPHLADWCAIDLLDDGDQLYRAAVAHVDPAKVETAWAFWKLQPPRPDDRTGAYNVMRSGQPELYTEISDELLAAAVPDPTALALIRSLGLKSSICVPLVGRGRPVGTLSLVSAESGRRYTARDLSFANDFALRIAFAVENARLYETANQARLAAEAMAEDVVEQSRKVEEALIAMRAERDRALQASRTSG